MYMENEDILCESMQDKIYKMHHIAFQIELIVSNCYNENIKEYVINNLTMTEAETDIIYAIVDGLTEKYIMDRITGHCSLQAMLDNPIEKLEKIVDLKIIELLNMAKKYDIDVVLIKGDKKMKTLSARQIFKKKYRDSKNFMTPYVLKYGKINNNLVYEVSSGEGFDHDIIYGITFISFNSTTDKTTPENDLSCMLRSEEEVNQYIESIKIIKGENIKKVYR